GVIGGAGSKSNIPIVFSVCVMEIPMFIEELLLFTITGCPKTPFKREMLLISRIPIPKNSIIDFFARYKLLLASILRLVRYIFKSFLSLLLNNLVAFST